MSTHLEIYVLFILGSMIGSFLNAFIYRYPRNIDLVFKRSHCTKCKNLIPFYFNVPILSFLFLRGKCAHCKKRFSLRYPFNELLVGSFFSWYLSFGGYLEAEKILLVIVFLCLLAHFWIDVDHQILPDLLNFIIFIIFIFLGFVKKSLMFSLIGASIGFLFPAIIVYLFYKLRGQIGMGGGDLKLYGALGARLGGVGIVNTIAFSSLLGTLFGIFILFLGKKNMDFRFAFGPYIIVVSVFQIYFPDLWAQLMGYIS